MNLKSQILSAALGAAALFGCPLHAAVYVGSAYESFDYSAGLLASLNGGEGFNANGDGSPNTTSWGSSTVVSVVDGNLTYGSFFSASQGNMMSIPAAGGSISRSLGQTIDTGTFYFSYLTRRTTDTERTVNVAFFNSASSERFAIGQFGTGNYGGGDGRFQISPLNNVDNVVNAGVPVEYGTNVTHLVIGRVEFDTNGANDRITIWIDPSDSDLANALTNGIDVLTPYISIETFDVGNIASFRPFTGGPTTSPVAHAGAAADFDEFRFGSTFSQVIPVPEPGSVALGAIGALGLAFRRRR